MSVAFADIKARFHTPKQREPLPFFFGEVLCANDTLIFGDHIASINKLLKEIETASSYYNLNLNYRKCIKRINLTANQRTSTIKYADGSPVPRQHRAVYLGTILTEAADNSAELQNRLAGDKDVLPAQIVLD